MTHKRKDKPRHGYKTVWHILLLHILDTVDDPEVVFPWRGYVNKPTLIATELLNICQHDLRASGVPEELIKKRNWLFAIVNAGDPLNVGRDLLEELINEMFDFEIQPDRRIIKHS